LIHANYADDFYIVTKVIIFLISGPRSTFH